MLLLLFHLMLIPISCKSPSHRYVIKEPAKIFADDINTVRKIPEKHKAFIARFLPEIHSANNKILEHRNSILDLKDSINKLDEVDANIIRDLNVYLKSYRVELLNIDPLPSKKEISKRITSLMQRADIIPVKLVMAQAIIESGWGSSKFAIDGNNYFGIHCYTEGCGVSPNGLDSATFYVKEFPTEMDCIEEYLWILNTGRPYQGLREKRSEFRKYGEELDAVEMAEGLTKYSEKGEDYVKMVSNIIRNYIPANADDLLDGKFIID